MTARRNLRLLAALVIPGALPVVALLELREWYRRRQARREFLKFLVTHPRAERRPEKWGRA